MADDFILLLSGMAFRICKVGVERGKGKEGMDGTRATYDLEAKKAASPDKVSGSSPASPALEILSFSSRIDTRTISTNLNYSIVIITAWQQHRLRVSVLSSI